MADFATVHAAALKARPIWAGGTVTVQPRQVVGSQAPGRFNVAATAAQSIMFKIDPATRKLVPLTRADATAIAAWNAQHKDTPNSAFGV